MGVETLYCEVVLIFPENTTEQNCFNDLKSYLGNRLEECGNIVFQNIN